MNGVQGKVALLIVDAGGVGEQHAQRNHGVRKFGVLNPKSNQVTHVIVQGKHFFLDQLQEGCCRKGLGNGGNSEKVCGLQRLLPLFLPSQGLGMHHLAFFDYRHRKSHHGIVLHELAQAMGTCILGLSVEGRKQECTQQEG